MMIAIITLVSSVSLAAVVYYLWAITTHQVSITPDVNNDIAVAVSPSLRTLRVVDIIKETKDAITIHFTDVDKIASPENQYQAGQYLTMNINVNGESLYRSYSFSAPSNKHNIISVTVKRVKNGRASNWLHEQLTIGHELRVNMPAGKFTLPKFNTATPQLVFIAGGSGITPIYSMLLTLINSHPNAKLLLIYGNNCIEDIIFHKKLTSLSKELKANLEIIHVLNKAPDEVWDGHIGLLDEPTFQNIFTQLSASKNSVEGCFLCGPDPMRQAVRRALVACNVANSIIYEESFAPVIPTTLEESCTGKSTLTSLSTLSLENKNDDHLVTLKLNKEEKKISVNSGNTILERALAEDISLPYSCMNGECGSCKVLISNGSVKMRRGSCLTKEERAQGYILSCMAKPIEPVTVEII